MQVNWDYDCSICGKQKHSDTPRAVCEDCIELQYRPLSDELYLRWLKHQRERIANGLKFSAWDDETIGNKDMYTSWGRCSDDVEAFPDPEYWAWKEMTTPNSWDKKRIRIISFGKHQACPFDMKPGDEYGCFYRCRIFQGKMNFDKEEKRLVALRLFNQLIEKEESQNGNKN